MDIVTYALSKKYTEKSLKGVGALKGAPCRVTAIEEVEGGNKITLSWTDIDGKTLSESLIVKNGEQGNGIAKVEKIKTVDLVDTYRMTFDDGTSFEYEITNGDSSEGGKIDIVKVNGIELPVVDKAVDIEIPDYIYIGNIEPTDENIILWVNPDEASDTIDIPIEQIKVNGILQISVYKVVDIKISDYIYIGNTEPTDEDIVLWVNPDESGGGTPAPTPTPENYYTKAETEELISESVKTLTDDEITSILSEIF